MKPTTKSVLLTAAAALALAAPAALGALHSQNRPPSNEGQAQTAVETVNLRPLVGTPEKLETAACITTPAETAPPETTAPQYITKLPAYEPYDFIPLTSDLQIAIY